MKYKTADLPKSPQGNYVLPALTAGIQNQGLNNYVPKDNATILKNVISISANGKNTGATFYQSKEFTVLQDAYAIRWKDKEALLSDRHYLFLAGTIGTTIYGNYEWTNKAGWEKVKTDKISLPITSSNKIDFDFIEEFIAELEERSVAELEAWLRAAGLDNCTLTEEEQQALDNMNRGNVILKEVKIGNLFKIKKGKRLTKANMKPGKIRFIGATSTNNGETAKIANNSHLHSAGTLTVTYNGSVGEAFFQDSKFWASDDVNVLYAKHSISKDESLYFLAPLKKKGKSYAYNYKWTKEKMKEDYIILPITPQGEVNYTFMATIISAVKKLVIKDVAHYAQKEIKAAQHVISK